MAQTPNSAFVPLTSALEKWFDKPFEELPNDLRERVKRCFPHNTQLEDLTADLRQRAVQNAVHPDVIERADGSDYPARIDLYDLAAIWNDFSAARRRSVAEQWDMGNDPATMETREKIWDLQQEIEEWEAIAAPTAIDKELRETKLTMLRQNLADLNASFANAETAGSKAPAQKGSVTVSKRKSNGFDYSDADAPIVVKMRTAILEGKARGYEDAARLFFSEAVGGGTEDSKVKRLAKRCRNTFPALKSL